MAPSTEELQGLTVYRTGWQQAWDGGRAAGSAGLGPSHLRLAPSGRGGTANSRPGLVRAVGPPLATRLGPQSESPASCTVRAGRNGESPALAGEGSGAAAGYVPRAPVRVACVLHRPGGAAGQDPGPGR